MTDATSLVQAQTAMAANSGPPRIGRVNSIEQARKVAMDFEAFYLGQMLQPMFAGINTEEPFGGGPSEETWRSMQVDEYGKAIARAGGVGIADMVFREILRMQEVE